MLITFIIKLKLLLSKILIFRQSKSFCRFNKPIPLLKKSQIAFEKRKRNDGYNLSSNNIQIIHRLVKLRNLAKHRPPSIQCSLSQIIMFVRFIYCAFYRNGFRVGANNKLDWEHEHPRANGGWWVHAVRLCTQELYIDNGGLGKWSTKSVFWWNYAHSYPLSFSPSPPSPPHFEKNLFPPFSWKYHRLGISKASLL